MGWSTDDGMHDGHCVAYFPGAAAYAGAGSRSGSGRTACWSGRSPRTGWMRPGRSSSSTAGR